MLRLTRRRVLRGGTVMFAAGLAGCSGGEDNDSSDDDESPSSENGDDNDASSEEDESASNQNSDEGDSSSDDDGSSSSEDGDTTESLAVGESYTNPIGNILAVTDIELQDTVEAERRFGDGELYQKEPQEGEQWAVVTVEITNDSGQTQYLTPVFEIELRANGTAYTNTAIKNDEDTYTPEEVQDGESRAGWLAYGAPAELTLSDIEVVHSNSADGESWTVTWSVS